MKNLNSDVTDFLEGLKHPMSSEIEQLRLTILESVRGLTENIKWNGPNYCFEDEDRVTMRVQPPNQIQLIFHRGVKKLAQPKAKLIDDDSGLLVWKGNDRAIATFKTMTDIQQGRTALKNIVRKWIATTR